MQHPVASRPSAPLPSFLARHCCAPCGGWYTAFANTTHLLLLIGLERHGKQEKHLRTAIKTPCASRWLCSFVWWVRRRSFHDAACHTRSSQHHYAPCDPGDCLFLGWTESTMGFPSSYSRDTPGQLNTLAAFLVFFGSGCRAGTCSCDTRTLGLGLGLVNLGSRARWVARTAASFGSRRATGLALARDLP